MPLQTANQYNLGVDVLGAESRGMQLGQQRRQAADESQQRHLLGQMEGDIASKEQAVAKMFTINPELAAQMEQRLGLDDPSKKRRAADFGMMIENTPYEQREGLIHKRISEITSYGGNPNDTMEMLQMNEDEQDAVATTVQMLALTPEQRHKVAKGQSTSRDVETAKYHMGIVNDPNSLPHEVKASEIALKLKPGAAQTIEYLGQKSDIKRDESREIGKTKLKQELAYKPQIEAAVTSARKIAQEKGEVFTDLNQLETSLPLLNEAVSKLRELAPLATSTWGGELWAGAVKQLGWGSTKGKTAQEGFAAIVNNQILPLLKPTFGGAMTEGEGKRLAASMGDASASPDVKMAQLDAFIEQKVRTISAKQAELKGLETDDLTILSDEQLLQLKEQQGQ